MLPVYTLDISPDDDSGVSFVSLVKTPAIEGIGLKSGLFLAFDKVKHAFKVTDEEKQIVSGPLMVPDLPIYRKDEHGEYYVKFTSQSIYNIVLKFFRQGNTASVNTNHSEQVNDVYMIESFMIDTGRMSAPKGFEDLPNGSWFGSYKVDNKEIWSEVKAGTFQGFSVEGIFNQKSEEERILEAIKNILSQ